MQTLTRSLCNEKIKYKNNTVKFFKSDFNFMTLVSSVGV